MMEGRTRKVWSKRGTGTGTMWYVNVEIILPQEGLS